MSHPSRRRRPPWWNESAPFPPPYGSWYPMRRRLVWRLGFLFFILASLGCSAFAFLVWLLTRAASQGGFPASLGAELRAFGAPAFVIVLALLFVTLRALKRSVDPVAEVIDAAERVAAGDYAARVAERGPREVRGLTRAFNEMTEQLQSNDAQRRRLLADVSHELRTPLTVIQGNLEGMLDGVYPMDRAHLEPVLDETRQLSRLIEDLRTLALAESGGLRLAKEATDLEILINETVASFRAQAANSGITLIADAAPNLTAEVDPARIRQVLENLIANALRYTPRGGEIRVTGSSDTGGNVRIAVKDTGRGISPQELPHIFERFYKARDSGGAGLGLAIAKSLVEAHGGEIRAESSVGEGTTISLTLNGPAPFV